MRLLPKKERNPYPRSSRRVRFYSMARKHKGLNPHVNVPVTDITPVKRNDRTMWKATVQDRDLGKKIELWKIPKVAERDALKKE